MQGRLAIFLTIVVVLIVLIGLNAASYVRVEDEADSEYKPNRSTTNAGATGTRALYDFLSQSGYKVVRWSEPTPALLNKGTLKPATFVVVGRVRTDFKEEESKALLHWVEQGGRLVIVDRQPDTSLMPASENWQLASELFEYPGPLTEPEEPDSATSNVKPVAPAQPTLLTRSVEQVVLSRFAGRLHIVPAAVEDDESGAPRPPVPVANGSRRAAHAGAGRRAATPTPHPTEDENEELWTGEEEDTEAQQPQPPTTPRPAMPSGGVGPVVSVEMEELAGAREASRAPVAHIGDGRAGEGALLVDYAYGRGRIVVLSDPFIIANGGISRADNLQLAVNVVSGASREGIIAFDEYHQGLGAARNLTLSYFAGTPVLGIFAQAAFIIIVVMWSRGRRFARPLPAPRIDRRSNLEFVASMAELQQRAHAYDLAIENVYARTRRALARYGATHATASYKEIAARVGARSGREPAGIETLMRECEDAIAGAPVTARKALALIASLRELERDLGIRMRAREIRQAEKR